MNISAALLGPLTAETARLVELLRRSVVQISTGRGNGSGVIWHASGMIVTNDHVIERDRADVELADGRRSLAKLVARDRDNDLALLHVPLKELPAACIGDSRALRVGELIVAVGSPFGVAGTATMGIVSATGSSLWMGRSRRELLQADVELAPGNSGGPLADMSGQVVGITGMIVSPGIAVATPSHVVQKFVAKQVCFV